MNSLSFPVSAISAEQTPVYHVNLSFVPSETTSQISVPNVATPESFITKEKLVKIAAYSLVFLGVLFLSVSMGLFAASYAVGAGASIMLGETMYPLGILSLLAGINLFAEQKDSGLKISSRLGPMTISI